MATMPMPMPIPNRDDFQLSLLDRPIAIDADWLFTAAAGLILLCIMVGLSASAGCQVQPADQPESVYIPSPYDQPNQPDRYPDRPHEPPAFYPSPAQFRLHELQTAERRRHRLHPQSLDMELCRKASQWAAHMASTNSLRHSSLQVHENIGCGQRSPEEMIGDWMNSSGHRANLLSRFDLVGFGHATAANGRQYWCSMHGPSGGWEAESRRRGTFRRLVPNKPTPIVRGG